MEKLQSELDRQLAEHSRLLSWHCATDLEWAKMKNLLNRISDRIKAVYAAIDALEGIEA